MAIQYVGGQTANVTASTATNTDITFSLTGGLASTPAANDIVIVIYGTGSTANRAIGVNTAGYAEIAELYDNDIIDINLSASWKRMGSTPDTTVQVGPTGSTGDSGLVLIQVYRGVDTTTALDVTSTTATDINSGTVNPPAITPTSSNTTLVVAGGVAYNNVVSFTASYLSNFITASNTTATNRPSCGIGWVAGPAAGVAYDPAAWTNTPNAGSMSWAAVTIALRAAAGADQTLTPAAGTVATAGAAPTASASSGVTTGAGAVTTAGAAPTASASSGVATGAGAVATAGAAPTVSAGAAVATGVGAVSAAGLAPTVAASATASTQTGAATVTGYPLVGATENHTAATAAGAATVTGHAPTAAGDAIAATQTGAVAVVGHALVEAQHALALTGAGRIATEGHAVEVWSEWLTIILPPEEWPAQAAQSETWVAETVDTAPWTPQ